MFVLLFLHDLTGLLEHILLRSFERLGAFAQKLPIRVVLGFRYDDALACDELSRGRIAGSLRLFHSPDKRFAERPDDLASSGLLLRIDLKLLQHAFQNLNVFPCL
jgi:hypothetical protein